MKELQIWKQQKYLMYGKILTKRERQIIKDNRS